MTVKGNGDIEAKIIADSVSPDGIRLTTMQLAYPRFIHSEFMTHRVFSRNAASSRAIPVRRMIKQVWSNPAMPIKMQANQRGMQSSKDLSPFRARLARFVWKSSAKVAASMAWVMNKIGVHKQWTNRILEPFQFIHVVVTATEWDNFFWLRDHEDAQPEIRELARIMKTEMGFPLLETLSPGHYHLPYIKMHEMQEYDQDTLLKASVARCARVSYKNHDKSEPDVKKDLNLYNMLVVEEPPHASPAEHQATPMMESKRGEEFNGGNYWEDGITHMDGENNLWSANLRGWLQYRQLLDV